MVLAHVGITAASLQTELVAAQAHNSLWPMTMVTVAGVEVAVPSDAVYWKETVPGVASAGRVKMKPPLASRLRVPCGGRAHGACSEVGNVQH